MSAHNKFSKERVVKNTAMLYFRMILILLISLYTTRIILRVLGEEDFGIYNVIAGFVLMLSFFNSTLSGSVQRFISFEIGRGRTDSIGKVFSMSINIHLLVSLILLILFETIGLWVLNNVLVIPENRIYAANLVYQLSVFSFLIHVIFTPYNAALLAYEKMSAFAAISIAEVLLKLLVVYFLQASTLDKLSTYSILLLIVAIIINLSYFVFVKIKIRGCKYTLFWSRSLFQKMIAFTGWNLWGGIAVMTYMHGVNILLNVFFGPTINAARAIAYQVNSTTNSFVNNFQLALKPQIIANFSAGNLIQTNYVIFSSSKISFFMMLILGLPLILNTNLIINLWLENPPEYVVVFCQLVLFESFITSISGPLMTGAQASGEIKLYQSVVGGILLLILPVTFCFLYYGYPPETAFVVSIAIHTIALFARVQIISKILNFSFRTFRIKVLTPIIYVSGLCLTVVLTINYLIKIDSLLMLLAKNIIILSACCFIIYKFGMNASERKLLKNLFQRVIRNGNS